jgi:hypothetical protein
MTHEGNSYHPVTREELEQIRNDCIQVSGFSCEECKHVGTDTRLFTCIDDLWDEVLARPDPLEVLEKWREYRFGLVPFDSPDMLISESEIISDLKTNPDAVIAKGKVEGWL